jgi:hydrogenase maturation factor
MPPSQSRVIIIYYGLTLTGLGPICRKPDVQLVLCERNGSRVNVVTVPYLDVHRVPRLSCLASRSRGKRVCTMPQYSLCFQSFPVKSGQIF